jgi:hypothetical protein
MRLAWILIRFSAGLKFKVKGISHKLRIFGSSQGLFWLFVEIFQAKTAKWSSQIYAIDLDFMAKINRVLRIGSFCSKNYCLEI